MAKAWTTKEMALARDLPAHEVMRLTGRSLNAVKAFRTKMCLTNKDRYWTPELDRKVIELRASGMTVNQISKVIGRSVDTIKNRMKYRRKKGEM